MSRCPRCGGDTAGVGCECGQCTGDGERPEPPPVPGKFRSIALGGRWYFNTYVLVFALLSAGPLALPLVWWHPRLRWWGKLLVTVATLLFTWGCVWAIIWMCGYLVEQVERLREVLESI